MTSASLYMGSRSVEQMYCIAQIITLLSYLNCLQQQFVFHKHRFASAVLEGSKARFFFNFSFFISLLRLLLTQQSSKCKPMKAIVRKSLSRFRFHTAACAALALSPKRPLRIYQLGIAPTLEGESFSPELGHAICSYSECKPYRM